MNRKLAALLAALLIVTLAGCQKDAGPLPTPDPPAVTEPEMPEKPEPPAPETPETPDEPVAPPEEGAATVTDNRIEDSVEESVGYVLTLPQVTAENAAAAQVINDYYKIVAGKIGDLAWGEVYEQAMQEHSVITLNASYQVQYNQNGLLSVSRLVTQSDETVQAQTETLAAETFNLENGGLITLDDLFAVSQEQYVPRLTAGVRAQIENDPYHDQNYYDQWESLIVSSFDKANFYLCDKGIAVFYQDGDLGIAAAGTYILPWDSFADILKTA